MRRSSGQIMLALLCVVASGAAFAGITTSLQADDAARNEARRAERTGAVTEERGSKSTDTELCFRHRQKHRADQKPTDSDSELAELMTQIPVSRTTRGLALTLNDDLFESGYAELKSSARDSLDKLAVFLKRHPEFHAHIEGHTDARGAQSFNQTLSLERAQEVHDALRYRAIAGNRLSIAAFGASRPVATNETPAGRERNRRVVVVLDNKNVDTSQTRY